MSFRIPHSKPTIKSKDVRAVTGIIRSRYLSQRYKVPEFEKKFAQFVGVKGAVATNSGTAALHLALIGLGVKKGDEVIIPTYVCTALINALYYVGATPVLVDVNSEDGNISIGGIKKKITKLTKAIIVPHMFGLPADLKEILKLKIPVVEDCAHSVGALYYGKRVGFYGHVSIFSFYSTKMLATGEGGMVVSNRGRLINHMRDLRDYDHKEFYDLRFNYKMTDIQAGLGLSQLSQLTSYIKRRKEIAKIYHQSFSPYNDIMTLPVEKIKRDHIYYRYVCRVKENRDQFIERLRRRRIQCERPIYRPIHRYFRLDGFPVADKLMKKAVSIPIYPSLTNIEVKYIVDQVRRVLEK